MRIKHVGLALLDYVPDRVKLRVRPLVLFLIKKIPLHATLSTTATRYLLCRLLPWNPIEKHDELRKSIFVLTTEKDLEVLSMSLYSIVRNLMRSDTVLYLVCPESSQNAVIRCVKKMGITGVVFLSDEKMLSNFSLEKASFSSSHARMQILKFLCALSSPVEDCLVVDGDTIYLRNRVWSSESKMVLVIPPEYHLPHARFSQLLLGKKLVSRLGYTTQSQILRKTIVSEMIDSLGGFKEFLDNFLRHAGPIQEEVEVLSNEWQLYGDYLLTHYLNQVEFASYLNKSARRADFVFRNDFSSTRHGELETLFAREFSDKKIGSVSLHAYKS